jgi:hypothetical protein
MSELIIDLIQSNDYKKRLLGEYLELKERHDKLHNMLVRYEAGALDFTPTCSITILQRQENLMWAYMKVLEIRMNIEGIEGMSTDGLEVSKE